MKSEWKMRRLLRSVKLVFRHPQQSLVQFFHHPILAQDCAPSCFQLLRKVEKFTTFLFYIILEHQGSTSRSQSTFFFFQVLHIPFWGWEIADVDGSGLISWVEFPGDNESPSLSSISSASSGGSFKRLVYFPLEPRILAGQLFLLLLILILFLPHNIELKHQFRVLFHLPDNFLILPLHNPIISSGHMQQTLLNMNEMPIDFLTGIVLFLLPAILMLILFDMSLIYFDERAVPILWVYRIDYHEDLRTQLVVQSLFVFERNLQIAILSLGNTRNRL